MPALVARGSSMPLEESYNNKSSTINSRNSFQSNRSQSDKNQAMGSNVKLREVKKSL